ncbi:hypothetical protein VOLCADRAFT_89055 [Volvox carteri f. nagariensis]|uniref:Uncharacterized protein n=1 Tax=Volvox carteri f. nagariensis TaxID=3068 RepID=D8TQP0_VOLCA|nr:uncharacterized protein VOLCADRAFT_89055 [Volvox carteri f. nagariensis]EFJ50070.1 hypothetical protein VOLCADRAFT_89055 [Volvox carteri f. nagariensis]|eukprot:XP_002948690.1 hypothetical protein VOLCADRAFT_89055 [Volvox carteri f. nagariensis]
MAVAAAPPPPGAISFRFDTDRTDRSVGGSKSTTVLSVSAATPAAAAAAAGSAAATNTNYGGGGGMVWRFDVGGPKAPPPPPPPVWRFDVSGGGSKGSWDHQVAAPSATSGGGGDRSGGGAGGTSLNGLHVRQQGGHFDRRMHGSNLYRNVALRALQGGELDQLPYMELALLDERGQWPDAWRHLHITTHSSTSRTTCRQTDPVGIINRF